MADFSEWQPTGWADELRAKRVTERVGFDDLNGEWADRTPPKPSRLRRQRPEWSPVTVVDASVTGVRVAAAPSDVVEVGSLRRLRVDGSVGLVRVVWAGSAVDSDYYYGCELVGDDAEGTHHIQDLVAARLKQHAV